MAEVTITKGRLHSDIRMHVALKDNGVAVDWSGLSSIRAMLYSVDQKAMAGKCNHVVVNSENPTDLVCDYSAASPQFEGLNRIVIRCVYEGRTKTYDAPAVFLVASTDDLADGEVVIDDPEVDVEIEVTEVSTSLLDEAIQAAFDAAELAEDAAAAAQAIADNTPYIIGPNGNWFAWDNELQDYVDTGMPSQGDPGFTIEPTTDPTDPEYQDEYQRILRVLYQAIEDAKVVSDRCEDIAEEARAAGGDASGAAAAALSAADAASRMASAASEAASIAAAAAAAAAAAQEAAKGSYSSLNERLSAIEHGKQDHIPDLETIRQGAAAGSTAYQKPSAGILKTDLEEDVRNVLDYAGEALAFEENNDPSSLID